MPLKLYRRKGSRIYRYRGTIGPAGRRKFFQGSCYTADKDIAARQVSEIESDYWRGNFDGPGAILTFGEAARIYRAAGQSGRFLDPVEDYLGATLVSEITSGTIQQMAMELFGHCSGASRNRLALVPAQAVINFCAKSRLCQPIHVERFKTETKEKPHATLEWVQAFMAEATPALGAFALTMFLTGARPTEALQCDIDLPTATALLHESKIGHERRAHLPAMLVAALANVPQVAGRPFFFYRNLRHLKHAWDGAIKRAGIQRLTPHCCRHGFITGLLQGGIDVKTAAWLADMTPEVLLNTYAHARKDRTLTNVLTETKSVPLALVDATKPRKTGTT